MLPDFTPCSSQDDQDRLRDILCRAFGIYPAAKWDRFFARVGMENVRVLRRSGRIDAALSFYRFGMWFGGRSIPCAGLAAVGCAPECRGAGLTRRLLEDTLRELQAEGMPLSALYPSTHTLYRTVGYEVAGQRVAWEVPLAAIGMRAHPMPVAPVAPSEHAPFHGLYHARARAAAGHLDRSEAIWQRITEGSGEEIIHAYRFGAAEALEGYVVYEQVCAPRQKYELAIRDWTAATPEAARALWAFLAGQRSLGQKATWWGPATEPWITLLAEPVCEAKAPQRWMVRLIDVTRALEQRGWPEGLEAELHLEVRDALIPANEGRRVLRVAGGRAEVRPGGNGDLRADVRGLAPLYTGFLGPTHLAALGLIEGTPAALGTATRMFAGPEPWMSEMF